MSCFIIPDSIIREIEAPRARFWWGTTPDHKRVHWKKWKDLCQPKALGGLGLRDFSIFNQALLGKQAWRFIQRPNSIISQVFKAKYFPTSSIWEAIASSSASFTWKSILWGRNLLAQAMRWRVGDGSRISIYSSRWIPKPWHFSIISLKVLPIDSKVATLLQTDGSWNADLVRAYFVPFEADSIVSLSRPSASRAAAAMIDTYCWHFRK
ncbi:hypothetical protein UlMin_013891 [Ulmus minor]